MTYTFKLSRRLARLRAPFLALIVALFGCDGGDTLSPNPTEPLESVDGPSAAVSYAGGIPIGTFAQPTTEFGGTFNGAMLSIHAPYLLRDLAVIKARGGKVAVKLAGGDQYYKDASGNFSLSKWKARVDLAKNVNFDSYINDGTIIGHYLIDEPQDAHNWNGKPLSQATVEEMAKHSKDRWPGMATIVRTAPDWLDNWDGHYRYLDAAWAQYAVHRWPNTQAFIDENVAKARGKGLALIVGLNLQDGGPGKGNLTSSQVRSYGSTLLRSTYPCAFISWKYEDRFLSASGMRDAMNDLRNQAENRGFKTCRGAAVGSGTPPAPPSPPSPPSPPTPPPPPPVGAKALPFGLSNAPVEEYSAKWTGAMYAATPALLGERLRRAESAGMKLVVTLVESGQAKNPDGSFSLSRWKTQLDRYRGLSLDRHISSQALYLHHLVDQPRCEGCWGGRAISYETIEEMARYSKSLWPSLPTAVRVAPTTLAAATFRWTHLDAGWAQYNTRQGDLRSRLSREVAQARAEGLGLVAGLNLLDGAGYKTAPMSARQVKEFGSILAADPSVCALIGWKYDAGYLRQAGVRDALAAVATVAKGRNAGSCRQ